MPEPRILQIHLELSEAEAITLFALARAGILAIDHGADTDLRIAYDAYAKLKHGIAVSKRGLPRRARRKSL